MDEWQRGFNDGIKYCEANYKQFRFMALPAEFEHRGNEWSRGFGEGLITGRGRVIDAAYPGNVGYSNEGGRVTIFYPKGHKALNTNE